MNGSPAGFRAAPLTRGLVLATLSSSVLLQAASHSTRRRISPLLVDGFSHAFVFKHPGELIFGAALTYYFRVFERQLGTGKYGAFVLITSSIAYVFQAVFTTSLHRPSASGLYPIIFANMVPFILDIPHIHKFRLFGLNLSDKAFVYLAAMQLLLSSGQQSVAAGLCGMLAGILYRMNIFGVRKWKLPKIIENFIDPLAAAGGYPQQVTVQSAGDRGGGLQQQSPMTRPPGQPTAAAPSAEALEQLESMGFDRDRATRALQASNNNLERAVQALLG